MATPITMPKLGMDMNEGTIMKWLKKVGDHISKEEPIFEVETDKATMEVDSSVEGILLKIYYEENVAIPINEVIAMVGTEGEAVPEKAKKAQEEVTKSQKKEIKPLYTIEKIEVKNETARRITITPRARKLADKYGVDYKVIAGSGPNGRIREQNVNDYMNKLTDSPIPKEEIQKREVNQKIRGGQIIPMQGIRKMIAARMKESLTTSAQANHRTDVDMTRLIAMRSELYALNEKLGKKISITDILIKIVTKALREQPIVNSTLIPEGILLLDEINIGIAVATDRGLVVPVIYNTKGKDIIEIGSETKDLIEKAMTGILKPDEMKGGTFTITNLGMYDVDSFTAIINPPESAILAVGRINKRAVVENDAIVIKPTTTLSLTYDHRVIDGAPAAIFLQRIKQIIENPYLLL